MGRRRVVAAAVVAALTMGVVSGLPHSADQAQAAGKPKTVKYNGKSVVTDTPIKTGPWHGKNPPAPPPAKGSIPSQTTFPAAAQADLTLTVPTTTAAVTAASVDTASNANFVSAKGVPVSVAADTESASSDQLPSRVRAGAATDTPTAVHVSVSDHATASAAGISGEIVSVSRADGKTGAANAVVAVDYSSFGQAYGGDYASRLNLYALPACALTTPKVPDCQKKTPLRFTNDDAHQRLTASVTIPAGSHPAAGTTSGNQKSSPGGMVVLAATATGSGSAGSYNATSLSASNSWSESSNTGSFTYSYPISVPPSIGGAAPTVALSYDSGAVDGHSTVENGQSSWIGDGWDYSPGYIERSYVPCSKAKPTAYPASTDNCFALDANGKPVPALTLSFGSHGGQLVHDDGDTTNTHFKLQSDDGTQIDLLPNTTSASATSEMFRVRLPDGTTAYFGADTVPAELNNGTAVSPFGHTDSTWFAPVFNNPTNSACKDPATAKPTDCQTAWRWNLDFVVDPRQNVQQMFYNSEYNAYGRGTAQTTAKYIRGGTLKEIDYGWQLSDAIAGRQPGAKVSFGSVERCIDPALDGGYGASSGGSSGCQSATITTALLPGFQDTPYDLNCPTTNATCTGSGQGSPTFWSTMRLATIVTEVRENNSWHSVDRYNLFDQFNLVGDQNNSFNRPPLWLAAIRHCAASNIDTNQICLPAAGTGSQSMPDVTFAGSGAQMANRVPGVTGSAGTNLGLTPIDRARLVTITDELGAQTSIIYDVPSTYALGCTAPPTGPADWHNTKLCFPEYWTPPGEFSPITDWFNKYVVTSVTTEDGSGTGASLTTSYTYDTTSGAAWHSNDSELVTDPKTRSYDQYRGFSSITTTGGDGSDTPASQTTTTYLRGMDWDPDIKAVTAGGDCPNFTANITQAECPRVSVKDSQGGSTTDDVIFNGQALETQTLTGANGSVWDDTVSRPYLSAPVATHARVSPLPALRSRQIGTMAAFTTVPTAAYGTVPKGTRTLETDNLYDSNLANGGRLIASWAKSPVYSQVPAQADTTPALCTVPSYAANAAKPWMLSFVDQTMTFTAAAPCWNSSNTVASATAATAVSGTQSFYDGDSGANPTIVAKGDLTLAKVLDSFNGSTPVFVTKTSSAYDGYGRLIQSQDALNRTTKTDYYSAATGELPNKVVVTNPKLWTSTTLIDPTRSVPTDTTDANGKTVHEAYDSLGRLTAEWNIDNPYTPTNPPPANSVFKYTVNTATPSVTETDTLRSDGTYAMGFALADSFGRGIQTQSMPVNDVTGRVVTATTYDSLGHAASVVGPEYDSANAPSGKPWAPAANTKPLRATTTLYDGMSRPTVVTTYSAANALTHAVMSYPGADRTDVTPPIAGAVPMTGPDNQPTSGTRTSTLTDARGNTTALYTYKGLDPVAFPFGTASAADVTGYSYDAAGHQTQVKDALGNAWNYTYNLQGQKTTADDPDTGVTTYGTPANGSNPYVSGYDAVGNLVQVQDGRGQALHYSYDVLNRKTAEYSGTSTSGSLLAQWDFDSLVKGQPSDSKRFTTGASQPYVSAVTGYDASYRPTGQSVTIPSGDGNNTLAGTYTSSQTYTPITGQPYQMTLPMGGDLQADVVTNGYNDNGLLTGTGDYFADLLLDSSYTEYGEVQRRLLGDYPNLVAADTVYDQATRRVGNYTLSALAWNQPIDTTAYTYNTAGRITSETDLQGNATSYNSSTGLVSATQTQDVQCFAYDYAGRLSAAWTDNKKANGTVFGTVNGVQDAFAPQPPDGAFGSCVNPQPSTSNRAAATAQLTGAGASPAAYWQTYSIDAAGDRTSETDYSTDASQDTTNAYTYPAAGTRAPGSGPHTLSQVTHTTGTNPSTSDAYTYDNSGNLKTHAISNQPNKNQSLTFDAEGHLAKDTDTAGDSASYTYDADGTQLIRRDVTGTTLYLGTTELHMDNSGKVTGQRYFSYSGAPTIVESGGSAPVISYEAGNLQGTATTTIAASTGTPGSPSTPDKAITARRAYTPFNTPRGAANNTNSWGLSFPDDHTFLGKSSDASTGLIDVGARKYDPAIGRFISADPLLQTNLPQTLGGYAYAGDDPVSGGDPSGLGMPAPTFPDGGSPGPGSQGETPSTPGPQSSTPVACADGSVMPSNMGCPKPSGGSTSTGHGCDSNCQKALDQYEHRDPAIQLLEGDPSLSKSQNAVNAFEAGLYGGPGNDKDVYLTLVDFLTGYRGIEHCRASVDVTCVTSVVGDLPMGRFGKFARLGADAADAARDGDAVARGVDDAANGASDSSRAVGGSCPTHSFAGNTQVLMADGSSKAIRDVKVGDVIENAQPGGRDEKHSVDQVHVTHTDKDFTDLTVATPAGLRTITGTQNHPYYDLLAGRFVNAAQLKPGDRLQTDEAANVTVLSVRNYTSSMVTYDLTIDGLHTFYVEAGDTPVLVHNTTPCGPDDIDKAIRDQMDGSTPPSDQWKPGTIERVDPGLPREYPTIGKDPSPNASKMKRLIWILSDLAGAIFGHEPGK